MVNLLQQTILIMEEYDKSLIDIEFIGSYDGLYQILVDDYLKMADFSYDDGYGRAYIEESLVIVFKDKTWLSRVEYDGAEWWVYNIPPVLQSDNRKIRTLKMMALGSFGYGKNMD